MAAHEIARRIRAAQASGQSIRSLLETLSSASRIIQATSSDAVITEKSLMSYVEDQKAVRMREFAKRLALSSRLDADLAFLESRPTPPELFRMESPK
jgi:ubiquinone biosynthesis protein COQ9